MGPIDLQIDQLLLDSENPRIGSTSGQREALQKILDDQGPKLLALATDIVNEGLSPMDRFLVIKENKSSSNFIVVEGNRRVASLKILSNPHLLTGLNLTESIRKKFEKLSKDFKPVNVEPISGFEMEDRETANRWILLRHTGANEGRGVVDWSGLVAARFRGTNPALQALEFVVKNGSLNEDQIQQIEESFPITTLDRLLSTKEVRDVVGLSIEDGKLKSGLPAEELIKPLRKIVLDLSDKKINVNQLKNKEQQIKYMSGFSKPDKPDISKNGSLRNVLEIKLGDAPKGGKGSKKSTGHQDPSQRKTVVPRGLKLKITNTKIDEIFHELKKLKMEKTPNACSVLIRVFLELTIDHYMNLNGLDITFNHKGHVGDKKLDSKVRETISHLMANKKGVKTKDFVALNRDLNDKESPLYIDLLNAYIHSRFQTPKVRDVRIAWDHAQPLFEQVWS